LTWDQYDRLGRVRSRTVENRFGKWNEAIKAAGLEVTVVVGITEEQLYSNLMEVWMRLGRQPTRTEVKDKKRAGSKYSPGTYEKRFGSWRKSLEAFVAWANAKDASDVPTVTPRAPRQPSKRPSEPSLRLKFYVMQRDGFRCRYCGKSPATHAGVTLHIDHVKPRSKGGETTLENLVTACSECNLGKGDSSMDLNEHMRGHK